jgi:taurine dioxygenase
MGSRFTMMRPLPGARFGGRIALAGGGDANAFVEAAETEPETLPRMLGESGGLLLIPAMEEMREAPRLLVRFSRIFGGEVEDYRDNLTPLHMVHTEVPEILVVSNAPPVVRQPPKRPDPPLTADGKLPVQFPHRRGWHTDQSYRRPPPDISLFLAVIPVPQGQGQTLFADGTAAYEALPPALKARVDGLDGLHVGARAKRSHAAVLANEPRPDLQPHERPQRQPVVRVHPVTGRRALYLCEFGQMDWLEGPIAGLEPGPNGEGGKLLFELMSHLTKPEFVYVHEWTKGDLLVWDNRCLVHAATWFDAEKETRLMWRTTVSGNPGAMYAGEKRSWVAA